jgi:heat shock protein HtpX
MFQFEQPRSAAQQRISTMLATLGFAAALVSFSGAVGYLALGPLGTALAIGLSIVLASAGASLPTALVMRLYRALPLRRSDAPSLYRLVDRLALRAGIATPRLYLVPTAEANAMAAGRENTDGALAVSEGLLSLLERDEIEAVLAHEIAHLRNGDISLRQLAGSAGQAAITSLKVGIWAALFIALIGGPIGLSRLLGLALMALVAPAVVNLLVAALSRTREFAADATAAELTGKPWALASALLRLSRQRRSWFGIWFPMPSVPPLLRSHPPTAERVARLAAIQREAGQQAGAVGWRNTRLRPSASVASRETPSFARSGTRCFDAPPQRWNWVLVRRLPYRL